MIDREAYDKLDPEAQAKVFRESSIKDKGELFLRAHHPEQLARLLSSEEFFLVSREMDHEERAEIIRYATLPQLFFVTDLECWTKDRISTEGFMNWLETLHKTSDRRYYEWLLMMDYETVIAGFHRVIQVLKPEWEYAVDEVLGDRPYFTLDGLYYVTVGEENLETVRRAMELLFENHKGRYVALLEGLLSEVDDVIEEEAYQQRSRRLSDLGFPQQESAYQIYRPLSEAEFWKWPKKSNALKPGEFVKRILPNYLVLWEKDRIFFDEALSLTAQEFSSVMPGLQEELAHLSNKVIACEGIDFSSEEKIRYGLERTRHVLSIGLEILSGQDLEKAAHLLAEHWLETIFRFSAGLHLKLRERAAAIVREHWQGANEAFLEFLFSPYEFIFRGLLQFFPVYYDPAEPSNLYHLRDFKTRREIEQTELSLFQMEILFKQIHPFLIRRQKKSEESYPQLAALLGTLFANFVLSQKIQDEAIAVSQLKKFIGKAFEKKGNRLYLRAAAKEAFLKKINDETQASALLPLWGIIFQEMEDQLGGLKDEKKVHHEFVDTLWIQTEKVPREKPFAGRKAKRK